MLEQFGLDDEEDLLDALAKQRLRTQRGVPEGTVGPTPVPQPEDSAVDLEGLLPDVTPLPPRVDLSAARSADAQQGMRRGFETAARQAIGGLTLTNPVDSITPRGTAEQTALADEERARADVLEQRKAQMLDRQKALAALLRPQPKTKTPEEIEAGRLRSEAAKSNAETYRLRTENDAAIARERLAAKAAAAAAKTKAAADVKPDEVPFQDSVFEFAGDPKTPKDVKLVNAKQVREAAAKWNTTIAALDKLDEVMRALIKEPSPANRAKLFGPALTAAGATNAAIGQGAMSDAEKRAQFQALGVNFADPASLEAWGRRLIGDASAAEDMVARVAGMRDLAKRSVAAQAQPYGYKLRGVASTESVSAGKAGPDPVQPVARPVVRNPKTGERRFLNADGSLGEVAP